MSKKYLIVGGVAGGASAAGFMGVRSYEYYRDLTTGREPIVLNYGY